MRDLKVDVAIAVFQSDKCVLFLFLLEALKSYLVFIIKSLAIINVQETLGPSSLIKVDIQVVHAFPVP